MQEVRIGKNVVRLYPDRVVLKRLKSIPVFTLGLVFVTALLLLIVRVSGKYLMQLFLLIPLILFIRSRWFWKSYQINSDGVFLTKYHFLFLPYRVKEDKLGTNYKIKVNDRYQFESGVVKKMGYLVTLEWFSSGGVEKFEILLRVLSKERAELIKQEIYKWRLGE